MIQIRSEVKKGGNSLAVVLPKDQIRDTAIKPGKKIMVMIGEEMDLKKEFGSLKSLLKKSTKELMKNADEGWR